MGHAIKLNRPIGRLRIGDGSMDESQLVGGSPADRGRLLERLHDYLDANARFDWETLQDIWSGAQEGVFFNLNGHTYKGREHWTRLWQFYQQNVASSYWTPFDIGGRLFGLVPAPMHGGELQMEEGWPVASPRARRQPDRMI